MEATAAEGHDEADGDIEDRAAAAGTEGEGTLPFCTTEAMRYPDGKLWATGSHIASLHSGSNSADADGSSGLQR